MLLAKQTANQESKQTFLSLSRSWRRLAVELEHAQALLEAINEMDAIRLPERSPLWDRERSHARLRAKDEGAPAEADAEKKKPRPA